MGTETHADTPDAVELLVPRVLDLLPSEWQLRAGSPWTAAIPPSTHPAAASALELQGWILHLSATPRSASLILERTVPILCDENVGFEFATDLDAVRWLGSRECGRAESGKFLTVYLTDDIEADALAQRLHRATEGLPGQRILTDRPYRRNSLVHYRFGGFTSFGEFDNDGTRRFLLRAPDGSTVPDRRETWHDPPPWAPCPFEPSSGGEPAWQSDFLSGLLRNRYRVRRTLRHSSNGGVYLATDTSADRTVVIRHARQHAESDGEGRDARARLLHEAQLRRTLATNVRLARPLDVFAADGDVFLVEERITGISFRQWVSGLAPDGIGMPVDRALAMARKLFALVSSVHGAGIVLRDLAPDSVLVGPDDAPALVAVAAATPVGQARVAEDLYGLGGLLFLLATGNDPVVPSNRPYDDGLSRQDRLAARLELAVPYGETARRLAPAALGLLADEPESRCDLVTAAARLVSKHTRPARSYDSYGMPTGGRLLEDGLAHLAGAMTPDAERLWPTSSRGSRTDSCTVQHGAAGVLAMFLERLRTETDHVEVARKATDWLSARTRQPGSPSPGLYFGRAGSAWVLADAGRMLDEPLYLDRALEVASTLPVRWPSPGVAHGLAGATLTHLHLYDRIGDVRCLDSATDCARELRNATTYGDDGPLWPITGDFDSGLAGTSHYGFAHGVAGVGYALLGVGLVLDDPSCLELAVAAGDLLCRVAHVDPDGTAWWTVGRDDPRRTPHWCRGSFGIGAFLVRLWTHTGDERFAECARAAAGAAHRTRWRSSTAACHGLAGDGQFLLDLADRLDDPTYRAWAEDLVPLMASRYCSREERALVPDESGTAVTADYGTGLAGVLAFLHRLEAGGPRPFTLDELLAAPERWPSSLDNAMSGRGTRTRANASGRRTW